MRGYGMYWVLIEMLRESNSFKLPLNGKILFIALSREFECSIDEVKKFINDCIYDFALFICDEEDFWSDSLMQRMELAEAKRIANQQNGTKGGRPKKQTETSVESVEIKKPILDKHEDKKRDTNENETLAQYPEEVTKLTELLIDLMRKNNPNAKIPDKLDKWHDSIRLMIQNDGYSLDQIKQLIVFSQNDSFWKGNILSTSKLRDKAGTLILQIGRNEDKKPVSKNQRPIINTVLDKGIEEELSHEEIERIRKQAREAEMVLRSQNIKNE